MILFYSQSFIGSLIFDIRLLPRDRVEANQIFFFYFFQIFEANLNFVSSVLADQVFDQNSKENLFDIKKWIIIIALNYVSVDSIITVVCKWHHKHKHWRCNKGLKLKPVARKRNAHCGLIFSRSHLNSVSPSRTCTILIILLFWRYWITRKIYFQNPLEVFESYQ